MFRSSSYSVPAQQIRSQFAIAAAQGGPNWSEVIDSSSPDIWSRQCRDAANLRVAAAFQRVSGLGTRAQLSRGTSMAPNQKVSAIREATSHSRRWLAQRHLLAIGVIAAGSLASGSAFASGWNNAAGCAAPAPEIGAGVLGAMLSVAAVRFFRRRAGE